MPLCYRRIFHLFLNATPSSLMSSDTTSRDASPSETISHATTRMPDLERSPSTDLPRLSCLPEHNSRFIEPDTGTSQLDIVSAPCRLLWINNNKAIMRLSRVAPQLGLADSLIMIDTPFLHVLSLFAATTTTTTKLCNRFGLTPSESFMKHNIEHCPAVRG